MAYNKDYSIKDFKSDFRLVCSDTWGNAMEAWFEAAGHMHHRRYQIPVEWNYRPGGDGDGREKDSYWYGIFKNLPKKTLVEISNFMFRYCQFLKYKGVDY